MYESILPALSRFIAYRKSLELAKLILALAIHGDERDQLHRAMCSIVHNLAEGSGEDSIAAQNRYYRVARGSLREVASVIDLLIALGRHPADLDAIVALIREIDAMLRALARRR